MAVAGRSGFRRTKRGANIARQHCLLRVGPTKGAFRPEGLIVPGIDALPSELLLQMRRQMSPAPDGPRC